MRFGVVKSLAVILIGAAVVWSCVSSGHGSDFDRDGLGDELEDVNANFLLDPGETDFLGPDSDLDGLCDGQGNQQANCVGCEDCNNNGSWEPCLGETDPLNDDTDDDGIDDAHDPAPLDHFDFAAHGIDCSQVGGVKLTYGASLPAGKPFPQRPTPTLTPAPFPTSTPGPSPTLPPEFNTPTPVP